jgi:hypothetical protein
MVYPVYRQKALYSYPFCYTAMSEPNSRQAGATQGSQLVRRHYLVAVSEKRLAIGRFGFREGIKTEAIVDIGNAKTEGDARQKAAARYAKVKKLNPILVVTSEVRVIERATNPKVDQAFSVMDLDKLATTIGRGNCAQCGSITVRVRGTA